MFGTFNVLTQIRITDFPPSAEDCSKGLRYWLIRIDGKYDAYAFRSTKTSYSPTKWEIVSHELLPDELKKATQFEIEILNKSGGQNGSD